MATKVLKNKPALSFDRRNTSSEIKKLGSTIFSGDSRKAQFADKPTPLDFDNFIPWVCGEMQIPEAVTVIRMDQEKLTRTNKKSSSDRLRSSKSNSRSSRLKEDDESPTKRGLSSTSNSVAKTSPAVDNAIPIIAHYDSHGHLTEITITLCSCALHRKVIQAISLCVPFHSFLTKLVIRKGCLDYLLLYEVSKLVPHSNLTDVCLDDTYVPEGNYYLLLDHASSIRYLSLSRCRINDAVCKEIALRIDFERPAEKSLMMLDLSSNKITDVGARHFGDVLRRNRHLLHLNFLGNRISDTGLGFILKHLLEFPLTRDEIFDRKRRIMVYQRRKHEVYGRCLEEVTRKRKSEEMCSLNSDLQSSLNIRNTKLKKIKKPLPQLVKQPSLTDIAEKMTLEIVGKFKDPYDDDSIIERDDYFYSTGNLKLCSLNVAYNHIEFPSLLRILEVLRYQYLLEKRSSHTGLMRLVLAGNYLPDSCPELESIQTYLKKALALPIPRGGYQTGQSKRRPGMPTSKPKA